MISKEEVKHIAGLARIGVTEKDINKLAEDFSAILDWMKQLSEVELKDIEPMAHISGIKNILQEDRAREFVGKERIIKLFPEEKDNYDKVKSIL